MSILPDILGYTAATLTTISFLPQAIQVFRTRDTKAISLQMYILFTAGIALWLVYGVMIESWPIIIANAITVILSAMILWMKLKENVGD